MQAQNAGIGANSDSILSLMILKLGILLCLFTLSVGPIDARSAQQGGSANEEELVKQAYRDAFGLEVPKPAYAPSIQGGVVVYWTSTAYMDSEILRLSVYPDGTYEANQKSVLRPTGTFRTVNIAIDYGNSNIADIFETLWVDAQNNINIAHAAFASEKGYVDPLVSFEFKNILVDAGDISDPVNSQAVRAFLRSRGIADDEYDVVAVLDMDAHNTRGGSASIQNRFIHMGWFFFSAAFGEIDTAKATSLANAVYGHEASHLWGWEHDWTNGYEVNRSLAWTAPVLMGWEDTDGDGIPEILDPTPYGTNLLPPILATPADQERDVPLTARLSWNPSDYAGKYHVQVSSSADFESLEIDAPTVMEAMYDAGPLELAEVYYWRVRARADGDVGFWSGWSETRSFVTTYGDGPVAILNPWDDMTLDVGEAVTLDLYGVFSSEDGSPLTYSATNSDDTIVKAEIVEVEFLDLVALSEGTAKITLRADDGSGGTASTSFLVTIVTHVPTEPRTGLPDAFALAQNHPNPFSRSTNITFDVPQPSAVTLTVYDMLGRQVAVIAEGNYSAGRNHVVWDAKEAPSGVYMYRLQAGSYAETRSMTVRK